jgi:hypothetical protein
MLSNSQISKYANYTAIILIVASLIFAHYSKPKPQVKKEIIYHKNVI